MLTKLLENIKDAEELVKLSGLIYRKQQEIRGLENEIKSGKGGRISSSDVRENNDKIRVLVIEIEKLMKELMDKNDKFFGK